MKKSIMIVAVGLLAASLIAADTGPKAEVISAAKKLDEQVNYSFRLTSGSNVKSVPPIEGKTEKGGSTYITTMLGNTNTQVLMQGDKVVVRGLKASTNSGAELNGQWKPVSEIDDQMQKLVFTAIATRNEYGYHAKEAEELAAGTKELQKQGDLYYGELTEQAAIKLLNPHNEAVVSDARGYVKFWIEGNVLSKYEWVRGGKVTSSVKGSFMLCTNTVEIREIGTSKIDVSESARKALHPRP